MWRLPGSGRPGRGLAAPTSDPAARGRGSRPSPGLTAACRGGYRRGVETVSGRESGGHLPDTGPVWDEGGALDLPALDGDVTADVCVVGLGGSGLAAVREARARGLSVVGLDAVGVGAGAAGRNGGFLLAGLAAFHHDAVRSLGAARATALYRLTLAELDAMEDLTPGLVRRTGSLRVAASAEELADCGEQLARMREDGLPAEPYAGPEGEGLLFPEDKIFDPLARCRRLASLAAAEGAALYGGTPAVDVAAGAVTTPGGRVGCGAVVVAVDGRLERLLPELAGRVRTARLQMLATAPTGEVRLPRPVYRRYGFEYYQQLPNGRLVFGGFRDRGGDGEWTADARPHEAVQTLLERYLRDELGVTAPITHRWAASVGYSRGVLPVFARLRGGAGRGRAGRVAGLRPRARGGGGDRGRQRHRGRGRRGARARGRGGGGRGRRGPIGPLRPRGARLTGPTKGRARGARREGR